MLFYQKCWMAYDPYTRRFFLFFRTCTPQLNNRQKRLLFKCFWYIVLVFCASFSLCDSECLHVISCWPFRRVNKYNGLSLSLYAEDGYFLTLKLISVLQTCNRYTVATMKSFKRTIYFAILVREFFIAKYAEVTWSLFIKLWFTRKFTKKNRQDKCFADWSHFFKVNGTLRALAWLNALTSYALSNFTKKSPIIISQYFWLIIFEKSIR